LSIKKVLVNEDPVVIDPEFDTVVRSATGSSAVADDGVTELTERSGLFTTVTVFIS